MGLHVTRTCTCQCCLYLYCSPRVGCGLRSLGLCPVVSQWDRKSGYRTRSILCVPIIDELHGGKCIGCLQLINKRDRYDRRRTVRNRNGPVSSATARQPGLYGRGPLDKPVGFWDALHAQAEREPRRSPSGAVGPLSAPADG